MSLRSTIWVIFMGMGIQALTAMGVSAGLSLTKKDPLISETKLVIPIESVQPNAEALSQEEKFKALLDLNRDIDQMLRPVRSCGPQEESPLSKLDHLCSMEDMCKKVEANALKGGLFENSKGESIPNFRLHRMKEEIGRCLKSKSSVWVEDLRASARAQGKELVNAKYLENLAKMHKKRDEAQAQFEALLGSKGERRVYDAYQRKAMELEANALGEKSGATDLARLSPSERIDQFASLTGKKFSDPVRAAYQDLLIAEHQIKKTRPPAIEISGLDERKKQLDREFKLSDPMLSPFHAYENNADTDRLRSQIAADSPRIKKLFDKAQSKVLAFISSRKKSATPKQAQMLDRMAQRVRTVKFRDPVVPGDIQESCASPNAFYMPMYHEIVICPQFMRLPEESVFHIYLHEFGHVFDYCNASRENADPQIPHVPFSEHPFLETRECLASSKGLGAKIPSLADYATAYKNKGYETDGLSEKFAQSGACGESLSVSLTDQEGEAFGDWVAMKIFEQDLDQAPGAQRKQKAFEAMSDFLGAGCPKVKDAVNATFEKALDEAGCHEKPRDAMVAHSHGHDEAADPHPAPKDRINRLFLSSEKVWKSLGCPGKPGVQYCD